VPIERTGSALVRQKLSASATALGSILDSCQCGVHGSLRRARRAPPAPGAARAPSALSIYTFILHYIVCAHVYY
jgi:hypothetical protein